MYNKDLQYQIAVMQSYADGNTVQFKKNCIDAAWVSAFVIEPVAQLLGISGE
jgi:hypothetical protein